MNEQVSIIIPCRNEKDFIYQCISSVLKSIEHAGIRGEILVVDGCSNDGTVRLIETQFKGDNRIRLIQNPQLHTPHALNLGISASSGAYFIILGAHAEVEIGFIAQNLQIIETHDECGCVGGVIYNKYLDSQSEAIGLALSSVFGVGDAKFRTGGKAGYVDTVAFGCYRKSVVLKIGQLNEQLVRNQDDEFNYRLTKSGLKIWFDPSIVSYYSNRASIKKLRQQYVQYGYWKVYVNKLQKTITTLRQLIPAIWLIYLAFTLILLFGSVLALTPEVLMILIALPLLLYLALAVYESVRLSRNTTFSVKWIAIFRVFVVLHLAYGFGYFKGLWRFLIWNKGPEKSFHELTR